MTPSDAETRAPRWLGTLQDQVRYMHDSLHTEEAHVHLQWVRAFVHFHGVRHPAEMAEAEAPAFLTGLAGECEFSPSTHEQALSAPLFLCRPVLRQDPP